LTDSPRQSSDNDDVTRGRLRIYLGAAPGVGKTYAMLGEGHRRRDRGTDVVVGFVETHDRSVIAAQIGDLETVPRRTLVYGGVTRAEMDLDAVLARGPKVALVDELAHTNVPGSRHEKRWQDIESLLDVGIDVISTVNVQHLESLNDVTTSITGVRERETVPDAWVRSADQIELVDMSPEALRRRMAHGNIYQPDRVDAALSHFFREGNLAALRELALLWLADRVDEGLVAYRGSHGISTTWPARERVVVAVTGGPESETLLRRASRIVSRGSRRELLAAFVSVRAGLATASPAQLERLRELTEELGGTFHAVVGDQVAQAILDFARGVNATQIVLGASRHRRWSAPMRHGVGEQVIAGSGDIDVHIVTHQYAQRGQLRESPDTFGPRRTAVSWIAAVVAPVVLTALLARTRNLHGLPTEDLLFMSLVVACSLIGGIAPAVATAIISALLLNYFFTPPLHTFTIDRGENVVGLILYVVVGLAVALVVDKAARRTIEATRARAEADALAALSQGVLRTGDDLDSLLRSAREVFGMTGAALVLDGDTGPLVSHQAGELGDPLSPKSVEVPVADAVRLVLSGRTLGAEDRRLLTAYAAHAAVILEREAAAEQSIRTRQLAEGNQTRTALLAAVSHDLRSPLSAIKAAVSSLRHSEVEWSADDERELLATIEESADRLDTLIGNLLDMSRIQAGAVTAHLEPVDVTDAVVSALRYLPDRQRVQIEDPGAAHSILADRGLLDRALANVLENALKYTADQPIGHETVVVSASSWVDDIGRAWVSIRVVDRGRGINPDARSQIFAPFQRLGDVPRGEGVGLGLAVARGLTEAMGGTVTAEDTPGGGLTMVIDLPPGGTADYAAPSAPAKTVGRA
jgi:two-component system sensor histidine kinase KdpD